MNLRVSVLCADKIIKMQMISKINKFNFLNNFRNKNPYIELITFRSLDILRNIFINLMLTYNIFYNEMLGILLDSLRCSLSAIVASLMLLFYLSHRMALAFFTGFSFSSFLIPFLL